MLSIRSVLQMRNKTSFWAWIFDDEFEIHYPYLMRSKIKENSPERTNSQVFWERKRTITAVPGLIFPLARLYLLAARHDDRKKYHIACYQKINWLTRIKWYVEQKRAERIKQAKGWITNSRTAAYIFMSLVPWMGEHNLVLILQDDSILVTIINERLVKIFDPFAISC
jgi:hypothetical protein